MDQANDGLPNGLECSVCFQLFQRPKILLCGHTFCATCLEKLVDMMPQQKEQACEFLDDGVELRFMVKCPTCRRETPLSSDGIDGLPTNLNTQEIVEQFKCASPDGCRKAVSPNNLQEICLHCKRRLCASCLADHKQAVMQAIRQRLTQFGNFSEMFLDLKETHSLKDVVRAIISQRVGDKTRELDAACQTALQTIKAAFDANKALLISKVQSAGVDEIGRLRSGKLSRLVNWLEDAKKLALPESGDSVPELTDEIVKLHSDMGNYNLLVEILERNISDDPRMVADFKKALTEECVKIISETAWLT